MRMTTYVCYKNHWSNYISHNGHLTLFKVEGYMYPWVKARHKPTPRNTCGNIPQYMQEMGKDKPDYTKDR